MHLIPFVIVISQVDQVAFDHNQKPTVSFENVVTVIIAVPCYS